MYNLPTVLECMILYFKIPVSSYGYVLLQLGMEEYTRSLENCIQYI